MFTFILSRSNILDIESVGHIFINKSYRQNILMLTLRVYLRKKIVVGACTELPTFTHVYYTCINFANIFHTILRHKVKSVMQ